MVMSASASPSQCYSLRGVMIGIRCLSVGSYFNSKSAGFTPGVNFPKPNGVGLYSPT